MATTKTNPTQPKRIETMPKTYRIDWTTVEEHTALVTLPDGVAPDNVDWVRTIPGLENAEIYTGQAVTDRTVTHVDNVDPDNDGRYGTYDLTNATYPDLVLLEVAP
jgi:hypothetical protein